MKKVIVLLALSLSIGFVSCKKEDINPNQDQVLDAGEITNTISVFGDWLLVDGQMYMENLETGEKTVYDHFDANKTSSSLRYSGYQFDFERIVVDSTMWSFRAPYSIPGTGQFWLDMDSIQPYGFYLTNSNMSIIEYSTGSQQLGGSSRPLTAYINEDNDQLVDFYVQETYESIGGVNYKYFSELTFEKQ